MKTTKNKIKKDEGLTVGKLIEFLNGVIEDASQYDSNNVIRTSSNTMGMGQYCMQFGYYGFVRLDGIEIEREPITEEQVLAFISRYEGVSWDYIMDEMDRYGEQWEQINDCLVSLEDKGIIVVDKDDNVYLSDKNTIKSRSKSPSMSKTYKIKGHTGTFKAIAQSNNYTLMQSVEHGDKAYNVILKGNKVFADKVDGTKDKRWRGLK